MTLSAASVREPAELLDVDQDQVLESSKLFVDGGAWDGRAAVMSVLVGRSVL